jgi:hypothetical protein
VADTAAGLWVVRFTGATPELSPGALLHDQRYSAQTGYRVDEDALWAYYQARGGFPAFGLPVSRTFSFLGCRAQIFQRQIAQLCPGQSPGLMNLLAPDLFPYTQVNGSTFPAPDAALKAITPTPEDPGYASAILEFVRAHAPDVWEGEPVNFGQTFFSLVSPEQVGTDDPTVLGLVNLELWGPPTSTPARDPHNANFIYQRFQRGIMHYTVGRRQTVGILLGDYVKQILRGSDELPPDLRAQAQHSRFFAQYCPENAGWLCRSQELPGTDLTRAFERG